VWRDVAVDDLQLLSVVAARFMGCVQTLERADDDARSDVDRDIVPLFRA